MKKKKILILTNSNPDGHRSIAKAIFSYLSESFGNKEVDIYYREVKSQNIIENFYSFYYKFFPKIGSVFFKLDKFSFYRAAARKFSLKNSSALIEVINKIKPDLVISSYYIHTFCLVDLREKLNLNFKLWTVVADPWKIYSASIIPEADLHLVYDNVGRIFAKKMGVEDNKILDTGWWVRPAMYKKVNRKKIRKSLGIDDDRPVIFVGGGGVATHSLPKILPFLLNINKKVAFIFNTGVSNLGFDLVEDYIGKLKRIGKTNIIVKNFGWIENMAEMLSACDIVLGKAGPNFLFDCIACDKPFVAITHISGQEDGNLELIKKKKLGWVKETSPEIADFLKRYLNNPSFYEKKYGKEIKKEALKNKKSMGMILGRIERDLNL
jgi:UDP-N-acetylglucosamine:LPS N-acetylglucosamine transferase